MAGNADHAPPVRAVVFDLGGVLIDWSPYHLYRKLLADDNAIAAFLDEIELFQALLTLDAGQPLAEWTHSLAARHPRHAALIEAYGTRWHETIAGLFPDAIAVARTLKAEGVPLYVLSNFGVEPWQDTLQRQPTDFLDLFNGVVISGYEGVVKPDAAIFELLCERYGLEPAECVFIDDNAANTKAAALLGFRTVLHHSSSGAGPLVRALAAFGLPVGIGRID